MTQEEVYAESHQAWLETFLDLKNGVPKADTYRIEEYSRELIQMNYKNVFWVGSNKLSKLQALKSFLLMVKP